MDRCAPGTRFVVVGGGVAGVCCAEELCRLCPDAAVTLVSADRVLKARSCRPPWPSRLRLRITIALWRFPHRPDSFVL